MEPWPHAGRARRTPGRVRAGQGHAAPRPRGGRPRRAGRRRRPVRPPGRRRCCARPEDSAAPGAGRRRGAGGRERPRRDAPDRRVRGRPSRQGRQDAHLRLLGPPRRPRATDGPHAALVSAWLGRPVQLAAAPRGGVVFGDPLTVVGTASLRELARRTGHPALADQAARLRSTLVVETDTPFVEDSWAGRDVVVGGASVRIGGPVPRCAVVDHHPETGVKDVRLLEALVRGRRPTGQVSRCSVSTPRAPGPGGSPSGADARRQRSRRSTWRGTVGRCSSSAISWRARSSEPRSAASASMASWAAVSHSCQPEPWWWAARPPCDDEGVDARLGRTPAGVDLGDAGGREGGDH